VERNLKAVKNTPRVEATVEKKKTKKKKKKKKKRSEKLDREV
jgi:hypothetical protein